MKSLTEYLRETSLSRVYKHINDKNRAVGIMTAWRGGRENKDSNIKRNRVLGAAVRNAKYGFFYVTGHWIETDDQTNVKRKITEDSIFIVGEDNPSGRLKILLVEWINEFDQEAALFKPHGSTDGFLLFPDGSMQNIGRFSPKSAEQGYTKLKGRGEREFTFESERDGDVSFMANLIRHKRKNIE